MERCGGGVLVSSSCYKNIYPSGQRGGLVGKLCKCGHLHSCPSVQVKRQMWQLVSVIPELGMRWRWECHQGLLAASSRFSGRSCFKGISQRVIEYDIQCPSLTSICLHRSMWTCTRMWTCTHMCKHHTHTHTLNQQLKKSSLISSSTWWPGCLLS